MAQSSSKTSACRIKCWYLLKISVYSFSTRIPWCQLFEIPLMLHWRWRLKFIPRCPAWRTVNVVICIHSACSSSSSLHADSNTGALMIWAPCLKCWSYIFRASVCSGPQLLRVEETISECKRQVNVPAGVRISTECPSVPSACIQTIRRPVSPVCTSPFRKPEETI